MEVVPKRPFNVLVSIFSSQRVSIPKGLLISRGAGVPHQVVQIDRSMDMMTFDKQDASVNLVHYKPSIHRKNQMESARDTKRNDEQREPGAWKTAI